MVEVNSTFYKTPSIKTVKDWKKANCKFLIKVNKYLTHTKKLLDWENLFPDFYEVISNLEEKLLGFVVQLPPSFQNTSKNKQRVLHVSNWCKENYPTVDFYVEFRDSSWFTENFSNWNIIIVHSAFFGFDFAGLGFSNKVFFRLHGTWQSQVYCGSYSDEQLSIIASCLYNGGIVVFNNTDSYENQIEIPLANLTAFYKDSEIILPCAVADAKRLLKFIE